MCWELKLKILGVEYENSRRRGERDDVATDEEDSDSTYQFGVIKGTKKKITREKREIRIVFKITKLLVWNSLTNNIDRYSSFNKVMSSNLNQYPNFTVANLRNKQYLFA